jgi:hypothetical protein
LPLSLYIYIRGSQIFEKRIQRATFISVGSFSASLIEMGYSLKLESIFTIKKKSELVVINKNQIPIMWLSTKIKYPSRGYQQKNIKYPSHGYQQKSNTHHPNTGKEDGAKKFHCQRSSMSCHVCSHNYGHNNNKLSDSAVSKENFVHKGRQKMSGSREN